MLELGGARLLTDPVLRPRVAHLRRHAVAPPASAAERLDAVLISHLHLDHLDLPSLRRLGSETALVVPRGAGVFLRRAGFPQVTELTAGEPTRVAGIEVLATRAAHDGRRRPLGGPVAEALGFQIMGSLRVYFAGDTDLFPEMADLQGSIDLALLPVWGWGTRVGPGHLNPHTAARAAALIRPSVAVPIHWGTLASPALTRRPELLREPPRQFADQVAALAPDVEVRVVEPGSSLELR